MTTSTDPNNCGGCGTVCTVPAGGAAICARGRCDVSCASGETDCNGTCVNTSSDPNDCGGCGTVCRVAAGSTASFAQGKRVARICAAPTGGTATCTNSACGASCPSGEADCNGVCPKSCGEFVVSSWVLPQSRTDTSIDLDGDGQVDNQFGVLTGVMTTQGFNAQTTVDNAVKAGQLLLLLSVTSGDGTLSTNGPATIAVSQARDTPNPDFSGSGVFVATGSPSVFNGSVASGVFTSEIPITTTHPVTLVLPTSVMGAIVSLPLNGAQVVLRKDTSGNLSGEIHGSMKEADLQASVIPTLATALTARIQSNPSSSTAMTLESLFDVGCSGDGATAGDGHIDPCEVAGNPLVASFLAPDVNIFNGSTYAPGQGTVPDSFSVGIGFKVVKASF